MIIAIMIFLKTQQHDNNSMNNGWLKQQPVIKAGKHHHHKGVSGCFYLNQFRVLAIISTINSSGR